MIPPLPPGEGRVEERPLGRSAFLRAWAATVEAFLDPSSLERRALDPQLGASSRLSPAGLGAAIHCILKGVEGDVADRLWDRADPALAGGLDLIVLPSNIPALVVQPLLRSLAARRRVVVKSASAEPHFAPAFVRALIAGDPAVADRVTVRAWRGGDRSVEDPLLARADRVIAYGDQATIDDLARRAPAKVWAHGPKTSLAIVAAGADLEAAAEGISRDVALFDQRGCLSVSAVFVEGRRPRAERFANALAAALGRRAQDWPPGPSTPAEAAAVQQLRLGAALEGRSVHPLHPLSAGTVVVEGRSVLRPGPGQRTVRVHPFEGPGDYRDQLAAWRGRIQGVALAGQAEETDFAALGVSRVAPAGDLQAADASWDDAVLVSPGIPDFENRLDSVKR